MTDRPPRRSGFSARSLKVRANQEAERVLRRVFRQFCREHGIPEPVEDYQFAKPDRKWEIDLAWPDERVGLEVQGGVWVKGAHSRGAGQLRDFAKLNAAQVRGWIVLQVTPDQLCTGETLDLLRLALRLAA